MSKLTAQEIIQKLQEYWNKQHYDISDFAFADSLGNDEEYINVGPMKEVDQHGGEGQGDKWWSIKYFPDHDIYLKVTGFYQSHYGTDFYDGWNCVKEVKPKEKTITVYE